MNKYQVLFLSIAASVAASMILPPMIVWLMKHCEPPGFKFGLFLLSLCLIGYFVSGL